MKHRVISLWQPWASLLAGGVKTIETRSWQTPYRGLLFIHAAKFKNDFTLAMASKFERRLATMYASSHPGRPIHLDLPRGAIVGAVILAGCNTSEDLIERGLSELELDLGDYSPDRFGWSCVEPVLFNAPVPTRGQQSLWQLDQPTLNLCLAQLELSRGERAVSAGMAVDGVTEEAAA